MIEKAQEYAELVWANIGKFILTYCGVHLGLYLLRRLIIRIRNR